MSRAAIDVVAPLDASDAPEADAGFALDAPDLPDAIDASDASDGLDVPDAPRCPRGQVACDDGCIAEGQCCGLPDEGIDHHVDPRYDGRRAVVSARAVVSTELDYGLVATSALVAHEGRLWFTFASHECNGMRTVVFTPSPDGAPAAVEARCETSGEIPALLSLTRDDGGLLGCVTTGAGARCGRWSAGPGTWAPIGSSPPALAVRWLDGADRTSAARSVRVDGGAQLSVTRFDHALRVTSEQVIAAPSLDTVTGDVTAGDVLWLLRQPVSRVQAPIVERIRGDVLLPSIDLVALGRFNDWQGSLAANDGGVALVVQTGAGVTLVRPDEAGTRGRAVLGIDAIGTGALLPFEDGWLYAGTFHERVTALRMDCAGRLREPPITPRFDGSGIRFAGLAARPDGRGFWVLIVEHAGAVVRSVAEIRW